MDDKNDQLVLEALRQELNSGNMATFQVHYLRYKPDFLRFARNYTRDEEVALDVYHDACIVLFENIKSGKLVTLSSTLKTYLFSIAKHMLITKLRRRGKEIQTDGEVAPVEVDAFYASEEDERTDELRHQLRSMGGSCRQILELFYYRRYSIDAIMHAMQYKNENTVKAHKSRCLQKLREKMQKQHDNAG